MTMSLLRHSTRLSKCKNHSTPWLPDQELCPWTLLEALTLDACYRLTLHAHHIAPQTLALGSASANHYLANWLVTAWLVCKNRLWLVRLQRLSTCVFVTVIWQLRYAMVTCEIKLFWNTFEVNHHSWLHVSKTPK